MNAPTSPPRVLFLCTGNSCRSQMAEAWARRLHAGRIDACSAGTDPKGVDPRAVQVMAEVGVDLSGHRSKSLAECDPATLDLVVTVCGHADEHCPAFLRSSDRTRVVHQGFDDPPRLAADATSLERALEPYRRVRDELRHFVERLPELLGGSSTPRPLDR